MTKRFVMIFIVVLLLVPSVNIQADAILGNEFYDKNRNKTETLGKRFYINSPSGSYTLKEAPGSEKDLSLFSEYYPATPYINGAIIDIGSIYLHGGKYWGIPPTSHKYSYPGWIPMDYLLMLYEREDFEAEHYDSFYAYTGSLNAVREAKEIVLWQWPGSDREKRIVDGKDFTIIDSDYFLAYKDASGREWGYINVSYAYWGNTSFGYMIPRGGMSSWSNNRKEWICLSDPTNSKIPSFYPAPEPKKWSPDGVYDWSANDGVARPIDNTPTLLLPSNTTENTLPAINSTILSPLSSATENGLSTSNTLTLSSSNTEKNAPPVQATVLALFTIIISAALVTVVVVLMVFRKSDKTNS